MTFLSVIITTHNRPAELLRALLHLAHQYYKNFEVIVVDDSIDNVKRINKRVTEVFPKILTLKYIDVPSINISGARNIGLRHSRGDYIAFLDDDDYWLPKKLILQLKRVREGYNFIFTGFVKVNQRGRAVYSYYPSEVILRNPLNY